MNAVQFYLEHSTWIVGVFLAGGALSFVGLFCIPAIKIFRSLVRIRFGLREIKAQQQSGLSSDQVRDKLDFLFKNTDLEVQWSEYKETLHPQDAEGKPRRYRATVQAGQILTSQIIIESPMRVEFFKHLPGILTSLGIIGTFSGLINGLKDFGTLDASDKTNTQKLVSALLENVQHAFIVSAIAIALSIFVIAAEKGLYTKTLKLLEECCSLLDELFQLGVGEEYLSQLVRAAEGTHDKTRQLKDSLVDDLKAMMQNLIEAQIQAMVNNNTALGIKISGAIEETFREPLANISKTVQVASGDQSEGVHAMLGQLLSTFMDRLEGNFGNQFKGMESMMTGLTETLEHTRRTMEETLLQLRQASTQGVQEMGASFQALQSQAAQQQAEMREAFQSFLRKQNEEQSSNLRTVLSELHSSHAEVVQALTQHGSRIGDASVHAVTTMGSEVAKVTSGLDQSVARIEQAIRALQDHSIKVGETNLMAIEGLNAGAENLRRAAAGLAGSWQATEGVIKESQGTADLIRQTAKSLDQSSRELRQERTEERQVLQEMRQTLEEARSIGVLSNKAREELTAIVSDLSSATDDYLTKIPDSLHKNFEEFTNGVAQSINRSQKELNQLWEGVIVSFNGVLSEFNDTLEKAARERKAVQR